MKTEGYNGWTNYPTWAVNLWLSNEKDLYFYFRELTETIKEEVELGPEDKIYNLSLAIKEFVEDNYPLPTDCYGFYGFYSDILEFALGQVNYYEIAENMIEG